MENIYSQRFINNYSAIYLENNWMQKPLYNYKGGFALGK